MYMHLFICNPYFVHVARQHTFTLQSNISSSSLVSLFRLDVGHPLTISLCLDVGHPLTISLCLDVGHPLTISLCLDVGHPLTISLCLDVGHPLTIFLVT